MHKFLLIHYMWHRLQWNKKKWPHVENMTAAIHSLLKSLFHTDIENGNMLTKCLSAVLRQSLLLLDNKREWQCVVLWIVTIWVIKCTQRLFSKPEAESAVSAEMVWNTDVEVWMEPAVGLHTLNCLKFCNVFVCAKEHLDHMKAACAYRMHWRIIHQHVMIVQTCGHMRTFRLDWPFESVI